MKAVVGYPSIMIVTAVVSHLAVVFSAPYREMDAAMAQISGNGRLVNQWSHPERIDETSRGIRRPSPDLAYSACVYDLSEGPLRVTASGWEDYMSVSVFAANADNIFVINDRQAPGGVELALVKEGAPPPEGYDLVVESPSARGIILQRRVAPTRARWDAAARARADDYCGPLEG